MINWIIDILIITLNFNRVRQNMDELLLKTPDSHRAEIEGDLSSSGLQD